MIVMASLDVDAVQAFVLVADFQSFTRAAEALDTSQAAISVKLKRLEDRLGEKLIERTPRLVRLSARGAAFLGVAREFIAAHERAVAGLASAPRRFTLGIADQVAGPELPILLARLHAYDPALLIEVQIEASRNLLDSFDRGVLDAAIVLLRDNRRRDGEIILEETFGWMAAPDFEHHSGEPLRLATQAEPCSVRSMATAALDAAGISWTEAFVGGGIPTIGAAVAAGLAVAPLGRRVAPIGTVDVGSQLGLPSLPSRDVMLYSAVTDRPARGSLKTLAAAIRSTVIS